MLNMMGSSYPTSGGSLSQNQIQGGNNSLGSMGMLHDASDGAPFDMSDFPQLTGRPSSAGGPQGQYGNDSYIFFINWEDALTISLNNRLPTEARSWC